MLAVVGTVPEKDFPLVDGEVFLEADTLYAGGRRVPVNRGTPALLAAAIRTAEVLNRTLPHVYLVGDIGLGNGSRRMYEHLVNHLAGSAASTVVFHYLQPDVKWHNEVLLAIAQMTPHPILVADAGFMYAAKMAGQSEAYELFTPDAGELAFLADEKAPHPFYTRGFVLHEENRIPDLILMAYKNKNAARYLLVKGSHDHIASTKGVHTVIDFPRNDAMEAMGGTGDTLTGIVSVLIESGMQTLEASVLAARINRLAGYYGKLSPASQVTELIAQIPKAMQTVLNNGLK